MDDGVRAFALVGLTDEAVEVDGAGDAPGLGTPVAIGTGPEGMAAGGALRGAGTPAATAAAAGTRAAVGDVGDGGTSTVGAGSLR